MSSSKEQAAPCSPVGTAKGEESRIGRATKPLHFVLFSCVLGAALLMAVSLFEYQREISFSNMEYLQIKSDSSATGSKLVSSYDVTAVNGSDVTSLVKVCNINNYPTSELEDELEVSPGCLVLADKDLTTRGTIKKYDYATITTVCATSEAGEVYLDEAFLRTYDLIFERHALLSSVTLSDDSTVNVYDHDGATGSMKTVLGKKYSKGNAYVHSLSTLQYPGSKELVGDSAFSLVFSTTADELQDCRTPSSIYHSKATKKSKYHKKSLRSKH